MKIIIEDIKQGEEDEIVIRCNQLDDSILQMIYGVKMNQNKLVGTHNGKLQIIDPKDVFYFESVDNKVFIYCEKQVYESKLKL